MAGLSAVLLTRTPMVFSDAGVPDVAGSRSILEVMFSTEDVIVVLVPNRLPFSWDQFGLFRQASSRIASYAYIAWLGNAALGKNAGKF